MFRKLLILMLVIIWLSPAASAVRDESEIKAAYLYNFTRFVAWDKSSDEVNSLLVCTLDAPVIRDALVPLIKGQSQGGRPMQLKGGRLSQMASCHVLFIGQSNHRNLPAVLKFAGAHQILTVSDIANFADLGGIIGLIKSGNVIRFEINLKAAQASGLRINSRLLDLSVRVLQ